MAWKYQAYARYNQPDAKWLGQIPEHWDAMRCKYIYKEFGERSEDGLETLLSVSEYYGIKPRSSVMEEGDFLSRAESLEGYKKCQFNDLVMNIMLAWKTGLGVTKYDGIVSPAYSVFRLISPCSPDYMNYLLRTPLYTTEFKTKSTGVIDSRLRLYPESFGTIEIIKPPIEEQEQIANFLDHETAKIDALIDKQQQLIKLLKEKRQAVISRAVTKGLNPDAVMKDSGVEWLGVVPEHWDRIALKRLTSIPIIDGPHETPVKHDDGVPFVSAEAVGSGSVNFDKKWGYISKEDHVLFSKRYSPQRGDILVIKLGATTGVAAIVDTDEMFNIWVPLAAVRCNKKVLPHYVLHALRSTCVQDAIRLSWTYGTQQTLGLKTLGTIFIPTPPKKEQEAIVAYLEQLVPRLELLIRKAENSIELLIERRTALISAAVTGKIDVRNWQPAQAETPREASA